MVVALLQVKGCGVVIKYVKKRERCLFLLLFVFHVVCEVYPELQSRESREGRIACHETT